MGSIFPVVHIGLGARALKMNNKKENTFIIPTNFNIFVLKSNRTLFAGELFQHEEITIL